MANMTIANNTNKPICSNGAIALMIDFKTTCKPAQGIKTKLENLFNHSLYISHPIIVFTLEIENDINTLQKYILL